MLALFLRVLSADRSALVRLSLGWEELLMILAVSYLASSAISIGSDFFHTC
jgi:hypothetical protein